MNETSGLTNFSGNIVVLLYTLLEMLRGRKTHAWIPADIRELENNITNPPQSCINVKVIAVEK